MQNMIKACEASGSDGWTDPDFPPNNASLFKDELSAEQVEAISHGEQTFRKDKDPFLSGVENIQWKRAAEILNPDEPVVIWSADIHSDDIQQGRLGNCYYLAALASCAVGEKDVLIRDLIVEKGLGVGVFGVKFFIRGRWVTVPVDDYFPCVPWGDQWKPIFASPSTGEQQSGGEKEIWPMVFEKAWAKLQGARTKRRQEDRRATHSTICPAASCAISKPTRTATKSGRSCSACNRTTTNMTSLTIRSTIHFSHAR